MRFTPKTEEELSEMGLIKEGTYNFEVLESSQQTSKSGNEMIKLKLGVWDSQGVMRVLFDYLLEAMPHKLNHFCQISGLYDKYKLGELNPEDCISKSGSVQISIEKGKDKPEGGKYPDRNFIKDYVLSKEKSDFINDDLPF